MCLPLSSLMHSLSKKSVSAFDSWIISTPVELEKIVVTTTKHFYSGKNTLLISGQLVDNIGIDLGGLNETTNSIHRSKQRTARSWLCQQSKSFRRNFKERMYGLSN